MNPIIELHALDWLSLLLHMGLLSLLSVGGGNSVMPDIHRLWVTQNGWLSHEQFTSAVALAQVSPGPNVLYVALVGWSVGMNTGHTAAAVAGALLALLGILLPSSLLTLAATRWAQRNHTHLGVRAFKTGLTPLVVALLAASAWLLFAPNAQGDRVLAAALLVLVATGLLWRTSLHLLWVLALGAGVGVLGWV